MLDRYEDNNFKDFKCNIITTIISILELKRTIGLDTLFEEVHFCLSSQHLKYFCFEYSFLKLYALNAVIIRINYLEYISNI